MELPWGQRTVKYCWGGRGLLCHGGVAYRVVLQDELNGVQLHQLPDAAVANREVVEQLQSLCDYNFTGGPVLQVSHTVRVREGGTGGWEGGREYNYQCS